VLVQRNRDFKGLFINQDYCGIAWIHLDVRNGSVDINDIVLALSHTRVKQIASYLSVQIGGRKPLDEANGVGTIEFAVLTLLNTTIHHRRV